MANGISSLYKVNYKFHKKTKITVKNNNYNKFNYKLGFGCSALGGKIDEIKSIKLLNYVYKKKIRYFDLAPSYGDGKCHRIFGKFLKSIKRNKVFVATKIGEIENKNITKYRKFFPNIKILKKILKYFFPNLSTIKKISYSEDIVKNTMPSYLKDLNTSYIDCIFLHNIERIDEIKRFLNSLIIEKKRGRIKHIGISLNLKNKISKDILKKFDFIQLENSINSKNFTLFKNKYPNIKSKFVFYGINAALNGNDKIIEKFKNKTGLKNHRLLNLLNNIKDEKKSTTLINSSKHHRIDEMILLIRLIRKNKSLLKIFNE